jgi:methionyl-tRNA formyltransferase
MKTKGKVLKMVNYNYADLTKIAGKYGIPSFEVNSVEGKRLKDYKDVVEGMNPDLILAYGWYYMIPDKIRSLAKYGAWGIHASLLPKYAGGAPLVWAIINGEKEAGVTLFRMKDGVDDGDIILQEKFPIEFEDTINEVYRKAVEASKRVLVRALLNIDKIEYKPQDPAKIEVYPQRTPEDGLIDWNKSAVEIYNFVRAQTLPYPCAFTYVDGRKIKVISARIVDIENRNYKSGEIVDIDGKVLVATKDFFIEIIKIDAGNGIEYFADYIKGRNLLGRVLGSFE